MTLKRFFFVLIILLLPTVVSCGKSLGDKKKNPGTVIYDGKLDGNYKSASNLVEIFHDVRKCMGIKEEIPYPNLRVYSGNSVPCGRTVSLGCQMGTYVILPKKTDIGTIREEFIHYLLWVTEGDGDSRHKSPYFEKCEGVLID